MAKKRKKTKSDAPETGAVIAAVAPARGTGPAAWAGFYTVLVAAIAIVFFHAFIVDAITVRLVDRVDGPNIPTAEKLPVFLAPMALDGYVWNRHAENLGKDGDLRLRFTDMDNAPEGREVHWNSAFAWYLRGLGEIYRAVTGDSLRNGIYRMSIWANPILLILAMGLFATLSARRFGPMCGGILVFGMLFTPTFYEGFLPAYPDHHGLIAFAILGQVFGIAWAGAGWVQSVGGTAFVPPRSLLQARHGMIFSAICGAAGLWISAFSTVVVTAGIGFGVVLSNALFARSARSAGCVFHGELWKLWAWVGAAGSLGFYLLEYFPNHLGMRLEVNHPLYALAWLGGGWGVATLASWLAAENREPFPWKTLAICAAACAILPLTLAFGGSAVYIPRDPFMGRLWKNIAELLPLTTRISTGTLTWRTAFGFFPLFFLLGLALVALKRVNSGDKAGLLFLLTPIFTTTALQMYQTRWGMLAGPLYIALAAIALPLTWQTFSRHLGSRLVVGIATAVIAILIAYPVANDFIRPAAAQFFSSNKTGLDPSQALHLLHRDMARAIIADAKGKPPVVLSSPNSSCMLGTMGGFQTIGTLYWENVDGLKAAARLLNAQSEQEAFELLKKHGVTHITFMPWENFMEPYFRLLAPDPSLGESFSKSFGNQVFFGRRLPTWLRPVPYPENDLSRSIGQKVMIVAFEPNQTRDEAQFHLARYQRFSERDPVAAEISFREILDRSPNSDLVRIELADLYLEQKRTADAAAQYIAAFRTIAGPDREQIAIAAVRRLASLGDFQKAAEVLANAADPADTTPTLLAASTWAFATAPSENLRDPKRASGYLARYAAASPTDPKTLASLSAVTAAANGDFAAATKAAEELEQLARAQNETGTADLAGRMRAAFADKRPWIDGN